MRKPQMKESHYFRWCLLTLIAMGISAPFIVQATFKGVRGMHNAPIRWIPETYEQRKNFNWFVEHFQTPEYIIVSWSECTIDDPRLDQLAKALLNAEDPLARELIFGVTTGYDAVRKLERPPLDLSRSRALKKLRGTLVGPDSSSSCAIVALTEEGSDRAKESQEFILDIVENELDVDRDECYLAGSPIDGIAIDKSSAESIRTYMIPSTLMVFLLCRLCLRSWPLTLAVIITALFGQVLVLSLVYFSGVTMNAVLTVMAPLVFVLTVSAGVHLVNYYHDEVRLRGQQGATQRALLHGATPCVLAAVTTAIGLCSLIVSEIIPVRHFGIFASTGLVTTTGLLFLVLPGPMARWSVVIRNRSGDTSSSRRSGWDALASFIYRYSPLLTLVCIGWMVASVFGLIQVNTSVKVLSLLVPESRTVRDYTWLEDKVGPMVPIEIVLKFDGDCPLDLLQRIELVRWVQRELNRIENLDGTMSAASFFPPIPQPGGIGRTAQRRVLRRQLEAQQEDFVNAHYLDGNIDQQQSWRISARAPALGDLDYGLFLNQIRAQIDPVLDVYEKQGKSGISATYTGIMPIVYNVQRSMLSDLISSYLTALVLVGLVMIIVLRSVGAGLVVMLPNMFPTFILFGAMGWLKIPVDIGSMMTASVALGIAVDGTLHFLNWFRREIANGCSRQEAVSRTFRHCARAITQTTFICGLGLLVYALSDFVPTRRFAFMMFTLLMAACVGDLLLLPALLVGPLGRWFVGQKKSTSKPSHGLTQAA